MANYVQSRWNVNVISPHCDDAALSIAATLATLASQGTRLRIVSCFTRSQWAPFARAGLREREITAIRLAEDRAFVQLLAPAAELVDLDLLDGPLREDWVPYRSWPDTYSEPIQDTVRAALIEKFVRELPGDAGWLLPLALEHRDHLVAREAALAVAADRPLLFYEDVPYVFWFSESDLKDRVKQLEHLMDTELRPQLIHGAASLQFWKTAASLYESQFSAAQLASMSRLLHARGGERVWVNARFSEWLSELGEQAVASQSAD